MDNAIRERKAGRNWYINYITLVSCLIYGFKTLDSQSITFFSDTLINDLHFSASAYTALSSWYYLSYGASSVVLGMLISSSRKRKVWLVPMTMGVGISSLLTSFVDTYPALVFCRVLSGFASGCSLSLILSIISKNLIKDDFGSRNGVINTLSSFIGSVLGPLFFAFMSVYYSWHGAFFISGIFLIVCALLLEFTVDEVYYNPLPKSGNRIGFTESLKIMFSSKVFVLCFILGLIETAANLSQGVFIPLYYTDVVGLNTVQKGWFLSLKGFAYIPICFVIPVLCDRISMKSMLVLTFSLAFIAPFSAFVWRGTILSAYLLALLGSAAETTVTIFVYMIPRRELPEYLNAEANGVILGFSVVFGGCIVPILLSKMIDGGYSIVNVLGICSMLFFICILISLAIPIKRKNH